MTPARSLAALALAAAALAPVPARAVTAARGRLPVVAFLDTGVLATHQEFDYRGPSSRTDQMVGWWDFTGDRTGALALPKPGQTWDTRVAPYDTFGHGTGVVAMAVGRNADPAKTPSAAPGYPFAVAKVLDQTSGIQAPFGAAIRWAVHTIHADVISMSIGSVAPLPSRLAADTYDAIDEARAAGVLVVVANGNGWANAGGIPGEPGWALDYACSTAVLTVGAAGPIGLLLTTDPEVTTNYAPHTASNAGSGAYADEGGTSFAAPFVAGYAARLIQAARAAHRPADPARIETLVKYSAVDTAVPPPFEGYGEVELAQLPAALRYARAGTLPGRPSPDYSGRYVEEVAGPLRALWSDRLRHVVP